MSNVPVQARVDSDASPCNRGLACIASSRDSSSTVVTLPSQALRKSPPLCVSSTARQFGKLDRSEMRNLPV